MKKVFSSLLLILCLAAFSQVNGQKVNGNSFSFPEGKNAWSDTVFRKLQTKDMKDNNIQPVPLALRYKFLKQFSDGFRYAIEITNMSPDIKIKFRVTSKKGGESYTIRLDPRQTKVFKKSHWRANPNVSHGVSDRDSDYFFDFKLDEEMLRSRD
ncbi:MAG: hypothetical protein M0P58_04390 [Bacteroidales bacterium]|nr:hypothetical protein [Bacteroidales bacterium]